MCGIIGYVGAERADLSTALLAALARLEYRGYDSAGLALLDRDGKLELVKAVGGIAALVRKAEGLRGPAVSGLAHTRWATHGAATEANAHPHVTPDGRLALVLNGIVENDAALRKELAVRGVTLKTANDAETLLRWIEAHDPQADLEKALKQALSGVIGNFAVVVAHAAHPAALGVARRGSPLAVARTEGGYFVVSDAAAVAGVADHICHLREGAVLVLTPAPRVDLVFTPIAAGLAPPTMEGFESFTLKEIHEQPQTLARALDSSLARSLPERGLALDKIRALDRVILVGCGSAYFAACAAKLLIERHARLPADAAIASELRLGDPLLGARTLVVAVSQSGETADTLACLKIAQAAGSPTIAFCNVEASTMAREAHAMWPLSCGTEIGVASTKAYTAMLLQLSFLAFELGTLRGCVPLAIGAELALAARELPGHVAKTLLQFSKIERLAHAWKDRQSFLFIGRHLFHQSACEGALKLRELAYVNAEGYAAGELKHGSIALIDAGHPVIAVAPRGPTAAKMSSSIHEVKARGARVLGIITEGDTDTAALCDEVVEIPATMEALTPILAAIPLQILSFSFAKALGRPIDRPRNLAKSVTVE